MSTARTAFATALFGIAAAWSLAAGAQQIFRIVGPDGKVTFSDRPPEDPKAKVTQAPVVSLSAGNNLASLPTELRTAAQRYPVTIYTAANCGPCLAARNFLSSRGVPFTERTVGSNEDIEALQRLAGSPTVPFATIGSQHMKGFSEAEWGQFLDAAGYPKTSQLPASWRNPAPAPLVAVQTEQPRRPGQTAANTQPQEGTPGAQPNQPPPSNPDNPAGIQF